MCSRFYIFETVPLGQKAEFPVSSGGKIIRRRREIRPGDLVEAAVYVFGDTGLSKRTMRWGFPGENTLTINARAESITEKPLFRENFAYRRCVLPADGFYEWNAEKEKADFSIPEGTRFYLAAIYGLFDGEERFVVLTTKANDSVRSTHDRMPLILDRKEASGWILFEDTARKILAKTPPVLQRSMEYEQQNLQFSPQEPR